MSNDKRDNRDDADLSAKRALCLLRLHMNLRFIELDAPPILITRSQRMLDESLAELGLTEEALWPLYPTYRIVALGRAASEPPFNPYADDCDERDHVDEEGEEPNEHFTHGATDE